MRPLMKPFSRRNFVLASGGVAAFLATRVTHADDTHIFLPLVSGSSSEGSDGQSSLTRPTFQITSVEGGSTEVFSPKSINLGKATFKNLPVVTLSFQEDGSVCFESTCLTVEPASGVDAEAAFTADFVEASTHISDGLMPIFCYPALVGSGYDLLLTGKSTTGGEDAAQVTSSEVSTPDALIWVWNYLLRIDMHYHYVGGCIQKNITHVGVQVQYVPPGQSGIEYFNMHICAWRNGRNVCVGLYNSTNGWCRTVCSSDVWGAVYSLIYALASTRIPSWLLATFAATAAAAVMGMLVII